LRNGGELLLDHLPQDKILNGYDLQDTVRVEMAVYKIKYNVAIASTLPCKGNIIIYSK